MPVAIEADEDHRHRHQVLVETLAAPGHEQVDAGQNRQEKLVAGKALPPPPGVEPDGRQPQHDQSQAVDELRQRIRAHLGGPHREQNLRRGALPVVLDDQDVLYPQAAQIGGELGMEKLADHHTHRRWHQQRQRPRDGRAPPALLVHRCMEQVVDEDDPQELPMAGIRERIERAENAQQPALAPEHRGQGEEEQGDREQVRAAEGEPVPEGGIPEEGQNKDQQRGAAALEHAAAPPDRQHDEQIQEDNRQLGPVHQPGGLDEGHEQHMEKPLLVEPVIHPDRLGRPRKRVQHQTVEAHHVGQPGVIEAIDPGHELRGEEQHRHEDAPRDQDGGQRQDGLAPVDRHGRGSSGQRRCCLMYAAALRKMATPIPSSGSTRLIFWRCQWGWLNGDR